MVKEKLVNYYTSGRVSIFYEFKKDGYLIYLKDESHFIGFDYYESISFKKGKDFERAIKSHNPKIILSLERNDIRLSELERAFQEVEKKQKEENEGILE